MATEGQDIQIGDGSLRIGDRVVYPNQGICRITGVETKEIAGRNWEVVTLSREEDGATVMVPRTKVMTIGLRKVASVADVEKVFDYFALPSDDPQLDWKVRHRENADRMTGGGLFGTVEVLKGLHALSRVRPLPQKERELYDSARHLLVGEIAAALNIPPATAEDHLDYALWPPPGMTRKGRKLDAATIGMALKPRGVGELDDELGFDDAEEEGEKEEKEEKEETAVAVEGEEAAAEEEEGPQGKPAKAAKAPPPKPARAATLPPPAAHAPSAAAAGAPAHDETIAAAAAHKLKDAVVHAGQKIKEAVTHAAARLKEPEPKPAHGPEAAHAHEPAHGAHKAEPHKAEAHKAEHHKAEHHKPEHRAEPHKAEAKKAAPKKEEKPAAKAKAPAKPAKAEPKKAAKPAAKAAPKKASKPAAKAAPKKGKR